MRLPTRLLRRKLKASKRDFGHIFILAGSRRFSGAAVLCALGALRSGAGLVTIGIPEELNSALIKIKPLEAMTLPLPQTKKGSLGLNAYKAIRDFAFKCDVLVLGPGIGLENSTALLARRVIARILKPMLIDADGLNALAKEKELLRNNKDPLGAPRILTPHVVEMSRLTGLIPGVIEAERRKIACNFSRRHKVTLVLKGHMSIVSDFLGNLYVNKTGNPGMATAGSGDVLSGVIGSFLGQGLKPFEAAKFGVYLHGVAGDIAAKEKGEISLIASDIADKIPYAIKRSKSLPA